MTPASIAWVLLAVVAAGGGGTWFGNVRGHAQGVLETRAEQDAGQVKTLAADLSKISEGITASTTASRELRVVLARVETAGQASTKELKDALQKTAPGRAACRFDADSMRIIDAAADRATARAADGIRNTVPTSGAVNR